MENLIENKNNVSNQTNQCNTENNANNYKSKTLIKNNFIQFFIYIFLYE